MSPDREPADAPVIVRWSSTDRRGNHRAGAAEYSGLQRLIEARFKAGDRDFVATTEGREVAWITITDGRRCYSYELAVPPQRLRFADECHEEVTRRGDLEPCDKPAVALRIDPEGGPSHPYPVCSYHTRAPMVPLRDLLKLASHGC